MQDVYVVSAPSKLEVFLDYESANDFKERLIREGFVEVSLIHRKTESVGGSLLQHDKLTRADDRSENYVNPGGRPILKQFGLYVWSDVNGEQRMFTGDVSILGPNSRPFESVGDEPADAPVADVTLNGPDGFRCFRFRLGQLQNAVVWPEGASAEVT